MSPESQNTLMWSKKKDAKAKEHEGEIMPIQVSIDMNIMNSLNEKILQNKLLPALAQNKIVVHLTNTLFSELWIDEAVTRRNRFSNIIHQLFNGKIILSTGEVLKSELSGKKGLFYDKTIDDRIRQILHAMAQGEQLSAALEAKRQELMPSKRSFDEDLRIRQEMNLKSIFSRTKKAIMMRLCGKEEAFDKYYNDCPSNQKIRKLQKLMEAYGIVYRGDISSCLDNPEFPRINLWLRSWYAYHYYTVKRWQPTLRKNDATDLEYIGSGYCADYFITNDKMIKEVGNISYNSRDKFICWKEFESKFLG